MPLAARVAGGPTVADLAAPRYLDAGTSLVRVKAKTDPACEQDRRERPHRRSPPHPSRSWPAARPPAFLRVPSAGVWRDLPVIGKLLGHSDIETTARYAHLARDSLHEAAERIAGSIADDIL